MIVIKCYLFETPQEQEHYCKMDHNWYSRTGLLEFCFEYLYLVDYVTTFKGPFIYGLLGVFWYWWAKLWF